MRVRIYKPARNAMQSGTARTKLWVLEFPPADARDIDPLMGWIGSDDTQSQVRLRFETRKQAEDYAREHGLEYEVIEPHFRAANVRPPRIWRKLRHGSQDALDALKLRLE